MHGLTGGLMGMVQPHVRRQKIRRTQNMKQVDEGLFAMVSMMGGELGQALGREDGPYQ